MLFKFFVIIFWQILLPLPCRFTVAVVEQEWDFLKGSGTLNPSDERRTLSSRRPAIDSTPDLLRDSRARPIQQQETRGLRTEESIPIRDGQTIPFMLFGVKIDPKEDPRGVKQTGTSLSRHVSQKSSENVGPSTPARDFSYDFFLNSIGSNQATGRFSSPFPSRDKQHRWNSIGASNLYQSSKRASQSHEVIVIPDSPDGHQQPSGSISTEEMHKNSFKRVVPRFTSFGDDRFRSIHLGDDLWPQAQTSTQLLNKLSSRIDREPNLRRAQEFPPEDNSLLAEAIAMQDFRPFDFVAESAYVSALDVVPRSDNILSVRPRLVRSQEEGKFMLDSSFTNKQYMPATIDEDHLLPPRVQGKETLQILGKERQKETGYQTSNSERRSDDDKEDGSSSDPEEADATKKSSAGRSDMKEPRYPSEPHRGQKLIQKQQKILRHAKNFGVLTADNIKLKGAYDEDAQKFFATQHNDLSSIEQYLIATVAHGGWGESYIFHLMRAYNRWTGSPSRSDFEYGKIKVLDPRNRISECRILIVQHSLCGLA